MRLLVVGGSGFIGRQFLEHADLSGFEVSATYHAGEDFPGYLERLNPRFQAIQYDLLKNPLSPSGERVGERGEKEAMEQPDFSEYDAAVYMAGNSNHTWALEHTDGDMMLNAVGLARFLKSFHGDLVLLSTGAVYFGHEGRVSPESTTSPLFPYGASKLAGELLAGWAHENKKLESLKVLRLYYAYGPGEEERRLIRRALIQFGVKKERRFRINGTGQSLMAPMHVTDVVSALNAALEKGKSGTYDLPSIRPYTVKEIVETAARVCGIEPDLELVPTTESTLTFFSEQEPFAKQFGFEQKLSLEAGMKRYLEHLRREPAG